MIPLPASRKSSFHYNPLPRKPSRLGSSIRRATSEEWSRDASRSGGNKLGEEDDEDEENEEDELEMEMEQLEEGDGSGRGLENTLEELGFGAYHWRLLALCGFGWMSDNSALQCIAVILPRVQVNFNLSSKVVGLLSASTMAGMMIGAVGWGVVSDLLGRQLPFNSTLFLTAVFGIGASFAPTFPILLIWMFFLGSAVGGSMPTDGTLFLENLPHSKQYLLTLLSVFFSLGAVLSSVVSLIFLPGKSCRQFEGCDIEGGANDGWRKVLLVLGLFNMSCALMRWFLFRLHESPRYLVTNGREQEAVVVLQAIATFNDKPINIQNEDVQAAEEHGAISPALDIENDKKNSELPTPTSSAGPADGSTAPLPLNNQDDARPGMYSLQDNDSSSSRTLYDSFGQGLPRTPRNKPIRVGSAFYADTPPTSLERSNEFEESFGQAAEDGVVHGGPSLHSRPSYSERLRRKASTMTLKGVLEDGVSGSISWYEGWIRQMSKLFVPQWRRTVILMWIIWAAMAFAYTMFNVWLPAVLEDRASGEGDEAIKSALQEFVLYSVAGCPGSMLGAWMIQTRLGRRRSLAIWTAATGVSTFAFIKVEQDYAVIISSMIISMAATAMYAVLYGMTPETFGTSIRGTACGTSAALSRLAGVIAPVVAGILLTISPSLPVFCAAAILMVTAVCGLLLPFERVAEGRSKGVSMAH